MSSAEAVVTPAGAGLKLRVEHLGVVYERDGEAVAALEDISLDVSDGEFICIVGPSGCGKSTLQIGRAHV